MELPKMHITMAFIPIMLIIIDVATISTLQKEYGQYQMVPLSLAFDILPRYKDAVKANVTFHISPNGTSSFTATIEFNKYLGILGMKARIYKWDIAENKFKLSFNMVANSMCENIVTRPFLFIAPMLGPRCEIKVGKYDVAMSDLNYYSHIVFDKFYYGRYLILTELTASKIRFCRSNITAVVKPI